MALLAVDQRQLNFWSLSIIASKYTQLVVQVVVVYLDFAKVFDTVPHRRLIAKLRAHSISGPVLNWIKSFLNGRKQCVRVNGTLSDPASVLKGIPQSSVLGPILFVIYINDLPNEVASDVLLFAGDTKIFRCIKSIPDSLYL